MRFSLLVLLAFTVSLGFSGCKKSDSLSRKDAIARTWKLTAQTSDPALPVGGANLTDVYAQLKSCFKDNTYIFESNGNYRSEEGASKCNDTDPVIVENGTWTLSSDQNTLSVTTKNGTERTEYTIISSSASQLQVTTIYNVAGSGLNYKQTVTFTAQ